jgi:hypothetical protein
MPLYAAVLLIALGYALILGFALCLCRVASDADEESEACYNELLREQERIREQEEAEEMQAASAPKRCAGLRLVNH